MPRLPRTAVLAALLAAATLAGCGRRGDPEYVTPAPAGATGAAAEPHRSTEPVKPKRPFVLDGLL